MSNASVHDFAILEYRDTIGGRAWHKPFGKDKDGKPYIIEMGANWVCLTIAHKKELPLMMRRCKALEIPEVHRIPFGSWWVDYLMSQIQLLDPADLRIGSRVRAEDPLLELR